MVTTEDVINHHGEAFDNQDLEEVMRDYGEDSVLVTNLDRGTLRGPDEIRGLFADIFDEFPKVEQPFKGGRMQTLTPDNFVIDGDFVYFVAHAESPENVYEFWTDTFYIPDDTIEFQTYAAKTIPKD